jgi:ABC-type sugar transport system ATPase subunit
MNVIKMVFCDSGVKNICYKLVDSMSKRVQEVILLKGETQFLLKLCDRIIFEGLD